MNIGPHLVVLSSLLLAGLCHTAAGAEPQPPQSSAPSDSRDADRAAVHAAVEALAGAFESRDGKSLAGNFTAEGEFRNVEGVVLRGREALEQAFTAFFARTPEVSAEVRSEALRFLSADSAIDEGIVTVRRGPANPARTARYEALVVREARSWKLAQLTETPVTVGPSIEDLSWLVGKWSSVGSDGAEIQTTYMWDPGKKFIFSRFTIKEQELAFGGTQVIGFDPATGVLHSWTFETNGGIGEADWQRDGDHWVLDSAGSTADGRSLVETNVLRRVNDDTFTWQSVRRTLDDTPLPDLAPVKVTRVKTEK